MTDLRMHESRREPGTIRIANPPHYDVPREHWGPMSYSLASETATAFGADAWEWPRWETIGDSCHWVATTYRRAGRYESQAAATWHRILSRM